MQRILREKVEGFAEKYILYHEWQATDMQASMEKCEIVKKTVRKNLGEYIAFLEDGFVVRRFTKYLTGEKKDFSQITVGEYWLTSN